MSIKIRPIPLHLSLTFNYFSFAVEPGVKSAVHSLSELCDRNVNSIKTCAECFEHWLDNPNDYFVMVCSRPHLIVYAKAEGFPYWPSKVLFFVKRKKKLNFYLKKKKKTFIPKVMSIKGNTANVAFFGDHTQADVPVNKCILYAKRNPIQNARPSEYNNALQVRPKDSFSMKNEFLKVFSLELFR